MPKEFRCATRGWSQADAVQAMRAHAPSELPGPASLVRQWKRWEAGEKQPSDFYKPIIAATFGTVTHAMFPVSPRSDASDVLAMAEYPFMPADQLLVEGRAWLRRITALQGQGPTGE
jgi:hypothetical protein